MNKVIFLATLLCAFHTTTSFDIKHRNEASLLNILIKYLKQQIKIPRQYESECKAPGIMCKNCEILVMCIETVDGQFEENAVQICNTPQETCLRDHCSEEPNPKCADASDNAFRCTATGVFPDPYDCSAYHICVKKEDLIADEPAVMPDLHVPVKCLANYGYNPKTTYCDVKLVEGFCSDVKPVPTCTSVSDKGPIADTSLYYTCANVNGNLRAVLHLCPHGTKLSPEGKCL